MSDQAVNAIEAYQALDVAPSTILSDDIINVDCDIQSGFLGIRWLGGEGKYVFAFNWIVSAIVGVIFLVVLVLFTVDIAIRSIKLSILRLLAPIPIISYIEPKSSKDGGMFSSWVKTLTSTYLDLFLRLAIIYFVIFLIQDMIANGIIINQATGTVGIVSVIFIWIGLFFFAKMAPKFIKDALGIKGTSMTNFGLSGALAAAGAVRQGGTIFEAAEAASDATRAQAEAYNQGKPLPGLGISYNSGRDHVAKILTGDQNMTGRRMSRGAHHLARLNITTPFANQLKQEMYDAQDEAALAHNLVNRVNQNGWNSLSGNEQIAIADFYRSKKGIGNRAFTADEVRELQTQGATMYASEKDSIYGKAKSKYEKVEGMQKMYGQARSYEAEYEGKYVRGRNFTNRALGGLGRDSSASRVQQWRTQNYDDAGATGATNARGSGVDRTPPGSM